MLPLMEVKGGNHCEYIEKEEIVGLSGLLRRTWNPVRSICSDYRLGAVLGNMPYMHGGIPY